MKRKILTITFSLLLMLTFATPAFAQGPSGAKVVFGENFTLEAEKTIDDDLVVFGGNVTLKPGSTVNGDLAVFGGNVTVDGTVDGDIGLIGGNANINGTVDGDIGLLGGNANVGETAVIGGGIGLFGGNADVADGAVIKGEIHNETEFNFDYGDERPMPGMPPVPPPFGHSNFFDSSDGGGFFGWIGRMVSDVIKIVFSLIILGLIAWLVSAFMPQHMMTVRETVLQSLPVSFGIGLITSLVALVGVLIAIPLILTICLAIVPILAYMLLGIAALFGWIVMGQIIGEKLLVASGRSQPDFIFSSVVGVVILTVLTKMPVIGEIPCLGWLLGLMGAIAGLVITITGLGAVLLTRFGTRPYPAPAYGFSGGAPSSPSGSVGAPGLTGARVRWTEPAPEVLEEESTSSEAELNAKIKAALAEADQPAQTDDEPAEEPGEDKLPPDEETPAEEEPEKPKPRRKKSGDEPEEEPETEA